MADMRRGGPLAVLRRRNRSRGLCTCCGLAAKPRLLLSSAQVEAVIHATGRDCEPAVRLIQPGVMMIMARRRTLDVDDRQASGQPPQVDQRRGPLRIPRRHSSNSRRDRAKPHSTGNPLRSIDWRVIDTDVTADVLQLTDRDGTGNGICLWNASASVTSAPLPYGVFTATRLYGKSGIVT